MKLRILSLAALFAASSAFAGRMDPMKPLPFPQGTVALFGPRDQIEDRVIELIGLAQKEILINHYVITSRRIASALVDAFARRHVFVSVILEASPAVDGYQTPQYFRVNDIPVLVRKGPATDNNRYMIIDRQTVATGSYEFTTASKSNDENLLVITEAAIAVAYYNNWVELASRSAIPPLPE